MKRNRAGNTLQDEDDNGGEPGPLGGGRPGDPPGGNRGDGPSHATEPVAISGGTNLVEAFLPQLGYVYIKARVSGLYLTVNGHRISEPASMVVQEGPIRDADYQKWFFEPIQGMQDHFLIIPQQHLYFRLDVYGARDEDGAPVGVALRNDTRAQKWKVEMLPGDNTWFRVTSLLSGRRRLDVTAGSRASRAQIGIAAPNDTDAQVWCAARYP